MIILDHITFAYPHHAPIFVAFDWRVTAGEVWAVLGPSGCGKSTLLMLLSGLMHPQQGQITIEGTPITRPRPRTGLILQEYGLLPWATVRENVALGLHIRQFYGPDGRHVPPGATAANALHPGKVSHWLARLGIEALADKYPGQISGGQRQRTAIARTLVLDPDVLLMDEPFSALDAPTREALQTLTLTLCTEVGLTIILVTHNLEEAAFMGQNVLLLREPPNTMPRHVQNPHRSDRAYRESDAYRTTCARLRTMLAR